jgi:hypothetical protein
VTIWIALLIAHVNLCIVSCGGKEEKMRSWSGQKNHTLVFIVHLVSGEFSRHMKFYSTGQTRTHDGLLCLCSSNECNHCEFLTPLQEPQIQGTILDLTLPPH